jgi:hypothetical protein
MQLVIGGGRRSVVQQLADALSTAGHAVDGICYRLDLVPIATQALAPPLCLLVAPRAEGGCRDVAASIQRRSPGTSVVLLTDVAPTEVWDIFDAEVLDGVVSLSCPFSDLEAALSAIGAGGHETVGFRRPATVASAGRTIPPTGTPERELYELLIE